LRVEVLEDRLAPAVSLLPTHLYQLQGSLADTLGGPALVADGGTLSGNGYAFSNNQGLRLAGGLANTSTYSVVMSLQLSTMLPYYKKLIDFRQRSLDVGLYVAGSHLQFYPGPVGLGSLPVGQDFQVALTRDGQTGQTRAYFNGVLQSIYGDQASNYALASANVLTFFEDDLQSMTEAATGTVHGITIYNGVLTDADVAALAAGGGQTVSLNVSANHGTVVVNEGQTASNSGAWTGSGTVTLSASAGVVTENANGTWSWSLAGADLSQTVTITASDGSGVQSASFALVVNDVPPTISTGGLSVGPAHDYLLNGNLADQLGGPALVSDGGALSAGGYSFGNNQGLRLTGALADTSTYSVAMTLQLNSASGFYQKLIDFQNRSADVGLYVINSKLQLYPGPLGASNVPVGQSFQVVLTRDGHTGQTRVYLNGVLQQVYTGEAFSDTLATANVLTFFEDDTVSGNEIASGTVHRILVFNGVLNAADVNLLASGSTATLHTEVNEGDTATAVGTWSDAPSDVVTLSASVGTVTQNSNGTWSWSYTAAHGASDSQTVVLTATDSDGLTAETSFQLIVHNIAPTITALTSSNSSTALPSADGNVTVQGAFTDPGQLDTHTATINWGDGTAPEALAVDQVGRTFAGSHHYATGGVFTVTVTVTDSDGAAVSQSTTAVVSGAGLVDGTLYVIGTNGNDRIKIELVHHRHHHKSEGATLRVETRLNGGHWTSTDFNPAAVTRIVIFTGDGNDWVWIDQNVHINAFVVGGNGNDHFHGGGGYNVLVGGAGNDHLYGGGLGNILIGGAGQDQLYARGGRSLLIGGSTANQHNLDALATALDDWIAGNEAGALTALGPVTDDLTRDYLHGRPGLDTFIAGLHDVVPGLHRHDHWLHPMPGV
jgi:hypothetical protein